MPRRQHKSKVFVTQRGQTVWAEEVQKHPASRPPPVEFVGDQVAPRCAWRSYLQQTPWGGSARDGRPRLIDYQEAGTGIWGSSVHYRKGEYMRAVMNEDLSSY